MTRIEYTTLMKRRSRLEGRLSDLCQKMKGKLPDAQHEVIASFVRENHREAEHLLKWVKIKRGGSICDDYWLASVENSLREVFSRREEGERRREQIRRAQLHVHRGEQNVNAVTGQVIHMKMLAERARSQASRVQSERDESQ